MDQARRRSHMGNLQAHTHPGHLQVPTHTGHLPGRRHMGHLPARTHMGHIPAALESLIDADRRDGGQDFAFEAHRIRFCKSLLFHVRRRGAGRLFERGICAQGCGEDRHSPNLDPQSDRSTQHGPCRTGPYPHL